MKKTLALALLFAVTALGAVACLGIGRYGVGLGWIWSAGAGGEAEAVRWHNIFFLVRLPRVLAALLIGSALGVSGAAFQAVFGNPLVSPNLCGVMAGASFGTALAMSAGAGWLAVQVSGFAGGCAAVFLAVVLAWVFRRAGQPALLLILGGIVSNALFAALLAVVKYTADPYDKLPAIIYWLMGSLAFCEWSSLARAVLPWTLAMLGLAALSGRLNVLCLGDESSRALGLAAGRLRLLVIALATVLGVLTVVLAGEVGWLGLIVPHVARLLIGPDNRLLLPASALLGALALVVVDTVARSAFRIEIPVGILTALVGVVSFVAVFARAGKGWA